MRYRILLPVFFLALAFAAQPAWAKKGQEPDYTQGDKPKKVLDWPIGPTGMQGNFAAKHRTKQIWVTHVGKNTPADGIVRQKDVIMGVNRGTFQSDAWKEIVAAINEAEKTENGGKLVLNIWRPETKLEKITYKGKKKKLAEKYGWPKHKRVLVRPVSGKKIKVTVTLPVLGSYSRTSPWECPKTKAIIDRAGEALLKRGFGGKGIPNVVDALGLLATGEEKYLPMLRDYARSIGGPDAKAGGGSWHGSYRLVFVAEYYLATQDEEVLPYITNQANYIGRGVSGVGTWSHGMAPVSKNGMYGPPGAYGAMNQCSITCAMGLVLAQKCGVESEYVDEAVRRALNFLRYYAGKGTIPYGDHPPALKHDNNGRNSQTAVLFDLAGDKESAAFFTRMTLASHSAREGGHTGDWWSWQWGALGAARGGGEAANAFSESTRYYTDMQRMANGAARHLDSGKDSYKKWSATGSRLLQYCLPRKAIYLTGKGGFSVDPIVGEELEDLLAAESFRGRAKELSVEELLEALGNWSLVVREQAAKELGRRDQNVVEELIAMLDSPNPYACYGASIGLKYAGRRSDEAVDAMIEALKTADTGTEQYFLAEGLKKVRSKNGLGGAVVKAAPQLLKLVIEIDRERDPYGKLAKQLSGIFFYNGRTGGYKGYFPNGRGVEKLDSDLVVGAMKKWLTNPNGGTRSTASSVYNRLSEEQLEKLWGVVYYAAKNQSPSGVMFAGAGQANSTILLAKHRFEEALPLAADYVDREGWGKFGRVPKGVEALSHYGSAVKPYMEMLEKEHRAFQGRKPREVKKLNKNWDRLMENLDKDFELKSIEPYLKGIEVDGQSRFDGVMPGSRSREPQKAGISLPGQPSRTIPADTWEELDRMLFIALLELSNQDQLTVLPFEFSKSSDKVWLAKVEKDKRLELAAPDGDRKQFFSWEDLTVEDRAMLAALVAHIREEDQESQAMACIFMKAAGKTEMANFYFKKAGSEMADKINAIFD